MTTRSTPNDLDGFVEVVQEEARAYRRLLRLVHRQRRSMIRRDLERLESLSEDIARRVPEARRLASEREAYLRNQGARAGVDAREVDLQLLAGHADPVTRETLRTALADLARSGAALFRRNVQNHRLAVVSLEMVREELAHLVGEAEEGGPAYSSEGRRATGSGRGVVDGRA